MKIEQATKKLLVESPFYGFILMSVEKLMTRDVETIGTRINPATCMMSICVNPDHWNKLSDDQQVGSLMHEVIHICNFHPLLDRDMMGMGKQLFDMATDAEANQYIEKQKHIPATSYNIMMQYPDAPKKAGTVNYYKFILSKQKNDKKKNNGDNKSNNNPSGMGGSSGSGGGDDQGGSNQAPKNHNWDIKGESSDVKQMMKDMAKQNIDSMLTNAAENPQTRGTMPGNLVDYVNKLKEERPPYYNWKSEFRRILGCSDIIVTRKTLKRPSRRFEMSKGTKVSHRPRILVAVDTSGSVSSEELSDFYKEIDFVSNAGVQVDVIQVDTQVTDARRYKRGENYEIFGRGGTYFEPAIDYYNEHYKMYDRLIYFTDGYADIHNLHPIKRMLWVITKDGMKQDYPGQVIYTSDTREQ